jgi:hypothetical protein
MGIDVVELDTVNDDRCIRTECDGDLVGRVADDVEQDLDRLGVAELSVVSGSRASSSATCCMNRSSSAQRSTPSSPGAIFVDPTPDNACTAESANSRAIAIRPLVKTSVTNSV